MILTTSILALSGAYLLWSLYSLLRNGHIARKIGLPYIYYPISEFNIAYFIFLATPLGRWLIHKALPRYTKLANRVCHSNILWRWQAKHDFHRLHGDVLITVTPGSICCNVADADTVMEIVTSRGRFPKPTWQYAILKLFGDNVVTCEDEEWARHRKYTSPPFNERNSRLVWSDSISQGLDLLNLWAQGPSHINTSSIIREAQQNLRQLALHVISSAGFGVYLNFSPNPQSSKSRNAGGPNKEIAAATMHFSDSQIPKTYHRTYRGALEFFNRNIVKILATLRIFPESFLEKSYAPAYLRQWLEAYKDVERYLMHLLNIEREKSVPKENPGSQQQQQQQQQQQKQVVASGERGDNLLSILVREEKRSSAHTFSSSSSQEPRSRWDAGLTDREILGNVFIFSMAGHETTAVTLQYAITMLALHPPVQEWLQHKLDTVLEGESDDPRDWAYSLFAKLDGPLCVMYETLRMFPPIATIPKWTGTEPQTLAFNNRTYTLPAYTGINLNCSGLHYNPKYWGPTAAHFDPSRWDPSNTTSFIYNDTIHQNESRVDHNYPQLNTPIRGSFLPFSDGYRSCLGRKFAEVEFVAVLATVFRGYSVQLEVGEGEMEVDARRRVEGIVGRSANENSLGMREDFGLVLTRRGGS